MATSPEALAVQQFLSALFKATSNGYLAVIQVPVTSTGREGHESDWQNMRTAYYAVRDGQAPDLGELDWTQEWYLVPALLSKQGRQKDAILESGCLWVDFDTEVNPYDLAPQPSVVVQTSEGRFHCYWLLDNPVTLVNLEYHNRRLAYSFGSDHSGWDGNQLLRLPAGVNAKHTPPWIVKMVHLDADRRYSLDDFAKLPDHPQLLLDVDVDATAIPQSDVPREYVFNQLREKMTVKLLTMLERKQPDRSSALWWMYHECYRLGFSREEAFLLIKGTPNDKFAEQRYNGEQSLWRDILSGYNQSEAGQKDRGIIDMMQATRQEKGTNADKVHKLGKLLTDDMAKHGLFMQTENPVEYYYLDQEETCLHQVDKTAPPFRKLLLDRYAINAGGAEYLQLFEHVMSRCQDDTPVKVYRTAHYDIANNAVYVNRFDNHMYRLDGKDVTLLQNGHDGIFFVNPPGALPWKYETPKTTRPWEELVFSCANLVTEGLQPRQIHHIIRTWVLSQFFRELMPVKPILFLHGEAGSGKTSVFKGIAQVLQGKHMGAHDLPQEDEEFNLQVAVNDLLFYDNVDSWKPWLPDKLAMTSTSYTFTRRKLYTDNIVMTYTVSCFIGLTARTPRFMRDDVAERVIPIRVQPFAAKLVNEREITERIQNRRGELWGELLEDINAILRWIRNHGIPRFEGNFRQADFAALLSVTSQLKGFDLEPLLRFVKGNQAKEAIEEDPMMYVLLQWLEKAANRGREVTPAQLHLELSVFPGGDEFRKRVPSPRGLSIKLGQLDRFLDAEGIALTRKGADAVRYVFDRVT